MRLDEALVARGLCLSRSRARDAVLRGTVVVNGKPARKPSQTVLETDNVIVVMEAKHLCVSSRGIKDISSSTVTSAYSGKFENEHSKKVPNQTGTYTDPSDGLWYDIKNSSSTLNKSQREELSNILEELFA